MAIKPALLTCFVNLVVEHPVFMDSVTSVLTHIQYGAPGRITMVVGPTGVGKSTLIRYCVEKLDAFVKDHPDCGWTAPLVLEAMAPESGEFSWSDFYTRALRALNEPCVEGKADIDLAIEALKLGRAITRRRRLTVPQLRDLMEQALKIRRPIVVFIDEIQHLARTKTHARKTGNLDVVKSISNLPLTNFVLAGTYEARAMMYHGAQLSRRVRIHHFQRYQDDDEERATFHAVIRSVMKEYKLPIHKDVISDIDYLYNHTLGCVGILLTWLQTAMEKGVAARADSVTRTHFEKSRLSNIQLAAIAREIASFESEHREDGDFDPRPFFLVGAKIDEPDITPASARRSTRPGIRKPFRDPVPEI